MLEIVGLKRLIGRYFHRRQSNIDRENPSSEMIASKEYYNSHTEEINKVCSILADSESVDVYKSMWKFRCTHNYKYLPTVEEKKQYFGYDFFSYHDGEKLIDCGAYDGDTIDSFAKCMKKHKVKDYSIVAFEPDSINCAYLKKKSKVIVVSKGVWDKEDIVLFSAGKETGGKIYTENRRDKDIIEIPVTSIDEEEQCKDATFLKMDIEGAEWNALHGAEMFIRRQLPKLAICIYHSDDDMVRIPMWIKGLELGYKLYIRQHSDTRHETVLYGVRA